MPAMRVVLDAAGAFPDITPTNLGECSAIARLPQGMVSGESSVCIELTLPDGSKAYGQTSMRLVSMAVQAFQARDAMESAGQAPAPDDVARH